MKVLNPRWSILIATVGQRNDRFENLVRKLHAQVQPFLGEVEILAYWNMGELPLPEIRQKLVKEARGDYVSFVDDDDMVPRFYCGQIMKAIQKNPDYIGFQLQLWHNGTKMKPTFHSLKYSNWHEDEQGYYRDISHLNPIKRSLVLQVEFPVENGVAEDQPWSKQIRPLVNNEVYIKRVMYFYRHTSKDSIWRGDVDPILNSDRPVIKYKYFRWHPESYKGFTDGKPVK